MFSGPLATVQRRSSLRGIPRVGREQHIQKLFTLRFWGFIFSYLEDFKDFYYLFQFLINKRNQKTDFFLQFCLVIGIEFNMKKTKFKESYSFFLPIIFFLSTKTKVCCFPRLSEILLNENIGHIFCELL